MLLIILFIFGLFFGSFFLVLIDRLPREESPFRGRSHCDFCKKTLGWFDLIPLVSFLSLWGKCRYCHKKLSWQYPIVELITGILFVLVYIIFQSQNTVYFSLTTLFHFLSLLVVFSSLFILFVTDFKTQILPDEIVVTLGVSSFLYRLIESKYSLWVILFSSLITMLLFYGLYRITKRRGIGFGDVKLVGVLSIFTPGILAVVTYYVAFLTGAAISLILIVVGKKKWGQKVAFGPFLIFGCVLSYLYGNFLFDLYKHILGIV